MSGVFSEIHEMIRSHTNGAVSAWLASGKPVVGYFCHYAPREIVLAAGALPLRLRGTGSDDSSLGDTYLSGRVCTYVRHVMSLALDGRYDFLDGEVSLNTCDHVRRAADVWRHKTGIGFHGFLSVPRIQRENGLRYYRTELQNLLKQLGDHFGRRVTDDDLREAIRTMNRVRSRLASVNRLRVIDRPKLTGAEALAAHVAAQALPPDVFIDLADRWLEELEARPGLDPPRARLVLLGAELDDPEYVAAIEAQGALVVADRLCQGQRSVLPPIDENAADPLDTVARAYYFSPTCARMMGDFPKRWEDVRRAVDESNAEGIVFQRLIFCDPWGAELHNVLQRQKAENTVPVLSLQREYGITPKGQLSTRVQAFIEKIEIARARNNRGEAA